MSLLASYKVQQKKMGNSSSKWTATRPARERNALVVYDERKAKESVQHIKSDFVDPAVLVEYLVPGDMIQKKGNYFFDVQLFYSHFAIYIGNGEIVHVTSPNGMGQRKAVIRRERMEDAFRGGLVRKNNHLDNVPAFRDKVKEKRKIVKVARYWVGKEWKYNFMTDNCEHFATWCRYGRKVSLQSWGIGDLCSGKITFGEYLEHSVYSIKEKATTLCSWMKRKRMEFFHANR